MFGLTFDWYVLLCYFFCVLKMEIPEYGAPLVCGRAILKRLGRVTAETRLEEGDIRSLIVAHRATIKGGDYSTGDSKFLAPICLSFQHLILKFARHYFRFLENSRSETVIEFDDLVSQGQEALLKAIKRFNLAADNLFFTYAELWIHNYIGRFYFRQRNQVRVSDATRETFDKLKKLLKPDYDLDNDPEDLRGQLNQGGKPISGELWKTVKALATDGLYELSLDMPLGEGDERTPRDLIGDDGLSEDGVNLRWVLERVRLLLDVRKEPERDFRLLWANAVGEQPTDVIGAQIKMTGAGVRHTLGKVRALLREDPLLAEIWREI